MLDKRRRSEKSKDGGRVTFSPEECGLVVALAYAIECPVILLPVGIVYVIEAMSDVIQIGSIKLRKKKVFKMAPIHHHFEMSGWNENKIVTVFTLVSTLGCAIGVVLMYLTINK